MRLFLAIPAPPAVREALASWARAARPRADGWRWVDPALLHVTLRFLGETDPARLERLVPAARAVVQEAPPHRVDVRGWGVFPGPARPRVLWAGLAGDVDPLARLSAGLEWAARTLGYAPEERGFRAHLTLARAARGARPRPPGEPDATAPEFGTIPVDEVILYRSHLGPEGPTYEPLARLALGGLA
ncbi:MAG: RNA 2',3'-cyclic phosphodiesterase [Acidobacteria bacterium]|jgi:2'-5' RNA ligase|nr:RNA 2',3'-cyclic phosphodiesterase [Acidobacteriota bacterium]